MKRLFALVLFWWTAVCLVACQEDKPEQPQPQLAEELATSEAAVGNLVAERDSLASQLAEAQGNEGELVAAQATAETAMAALANVQATALASQNEAEIQANRAFAHQIAALSLTKLDTDLPTAVLLAVQASKIADTPTTRSALLYALQHNPRLHKMLYTDKSWTEDFAFSPDGRYLAAALPEGEILLYDLSADTLTGENLTGLSEEWAGESGPPARVSFSSDGKWIIGVNPVFSSDAEEENKAVIWDVETRQIVAASTHDFIDLLFLSDDIHLVSYDYEQAMLWELRGGQMVEVSSLELPEDYQQAGVGDIVAHPKDNIVVLGYLDGQLQLWNPFTNEVSNFPGFESSSRILHLAYNPSGTILAVDGILWDTVQNAPFGTPISASGVVEFSQDGKTLLTAGNSEIIRLWDVDTQKLIGDPLERWGNTRVLIDAALHPNGNIVASSYQWGLTLIWDKTVSTRLGQVLVEFSDDQESPKYFSEAFINANTLVARGGYGALAFIDIVSGDILSTTNGYPDPNLRDVVYNDDYSVAATHVYTNKVSTLIIWDVLNNEPIGQPIILTDIPSSLALNPDGTLLAIGSGEGVLRFWDVASKTFTGEPIADVDRAIIALAFSPDGQTLASSGFWEVHLRNSQTRQLLFPPIQASGEQLIFHPQNNTFMVLNYGGFPVHIWDATTGEYRGLIPQTHEISGLAFSPDGHYRALAQLEYISFGGRGRSTALWDVETQLPIGFDISGNWFPVFNEDGSLLVTTHLPSDTNPQEIVLWNMGLERWQEEACRLVNQNFSEEEWGLHFVGRPYEQTCTTTP
jgi:WD40 repeat protein